MVSEDQVSGRALGQVGGQDKCNISGDHTSPTILLTPTDGPIGHIQSALLVLRGSGTTKEWRKELMWWDMHMMNMNGKSLFKKEVDMIIDSDASLTGVGGGGGGGATSQNQRIRGLW